jgi:hypothetical protein
VVECQYQDRRSAAAPTKPYLPEKPPKPPWAIVVSG